MLTSCQCMIPRWETNPQAGKLILQIIYNSQVMKLVSVRTNFSHSTENTYMVGDISMEKKERKKERKAIKGSEFNVYNFCSFWQNKYGGFA